MIGLGPKRKAPSLRAPEHVGLPEDDDDIFVPEPPDEHFPNKQQRPPQRASEYRAPVAPSSSPSSIKTRLVLRRALLRQARAQRGSRDAAPPPANPLGSGKHTKPHSPLAKNKAAVGRSWRPKGFQLGIAAAAAGIVCGTALAYVANDYFDGSGDFEEAQLSGATAEKPATQVSAASPVPAELSKASATAEYVEPLEDGEPPSPEVSETAETEPLPVPAASDAMDSTAAAELDQPEANGASAGEAQQSEVLEAPSDAQPSTNEPAAVASIDESVPTAPARSELVPNTVEAFRDCDLCPAMVKIPPAQFTMGSPPTEEGHQPNEGPQRLVTFTKPFAIGQFEITIGDWEACAKEGGCKVQIEDEGWGRENRPAINVSWEDITGQYLPWLSKKTGHTYRLPTEAEWEYAARAARNTDSLAPMFSFGDDTKELCAYGNGADSTAKEQNGGRAGADCRDGFATTAPAGSFKPNQFGLFDVHGNVWEWVQDCWNESYEKAPADGSAWTSGDCSSRIVRGGSWNSDVPKLRSAARGWNQPSGRNRSIGFRVVREL
jgi:formylglycine-generating enzyme required for sulfatase activity